MSLNLSDRPVAIVTGAFRGIGRACASGLAKAGFNLLLNDRDNDANRELAPSIANELEDLGANSLPVFADVSKLEVHSAMLGATISRWGRVDCLVNNAGVPARQRGDLLDVKAESFDECISVNTRAVFFLTQAVARHMLAQQPE